MHASIRIWLPIVLVAVLTQRSTVCAQDWPDVFNPLRVLHLNLEMAEGDWSTVRNDTTNSIEVPARFWASEELPIDVAVRRKSSMGLGDKVSLKIDINDFRVGQKWRGLNKLSLENGGDTDVLSEGLAWYLHRQAAEALNYGYTPGLAAWVNLSVNGQNLGIYTHAEQLDKQFFRNRDLYVNGQTWLYKQGEMGPPTLEFGEPHSPTFTALNYSPFVDGGTTPNPAALASQLPALINMPGLMSIGAVNAFTTNPDEIFSHGKNFFYSDFAADHPSGEKRLYFPWDLDAIFRQSRESIYGSGNEAYQQVILANPMFRCQFNRAMLDLVDGPFQADQIGAFLDQLEPVLRPYLLNDPNSGIEGDVAGHFDSLKDWITARNANVRQQILSDTVATEVDGDVNCDGRVNRDDVSLLASHFGGRGGWLQGDLDGDGLVSLADSRLLQSRLDASGVGGSAVVPEPSTIGILGCAMICAWFSWRRRLTSRLE